MSSSKSSDAGAAVTLTTPCKVNLTLDVFAPRPDGYHNLDSVVALFSPPADTVTVTVRPGTPGVTLIAKHVPEGFPKGPENLAHRAATAYQERFGLAARIFVKLDKHLPMQAGLGGGSSDAAAVLIALHRTTEASDLSALAELAATLGSDVPLFLPQCPAVRMQGRGEQVNPLPAALPPLWGVIVQPAVGVPTGPAYAALDSLPGRTPGSATPRLLAALADGAVPDAHALAPLLSSDFEAAVLPAYPEVAAAHRALGEAGALRALLCGSGSAVFGLASDRAHARTLVRALVGRFPYVRLAQSIPSPEASS